MGKKFQKIAEEGKPGGGGNKEREAAMVRKVWQSDKIMLLTEELTLRSAVAEWPKALLLGEKINERARDPRFALDMGDLKNN